MARVGNTADGNGQDKAPPPDLDTILEQRRASKARGKKVKPTADEGEPAVNVGYKPPPPPPVDSLDGGEEKEEGPDPFDPKNLRVDPISIEGIGERVLVEGQIAVRKPNRREYFKAHPDPAARTR